MKSNWDERIYESIALKRSAFFRPIAIVLSKMRISPDLISYSGLLAMAGFAWALGNGHTLRAFWLIVAVLVIDQLDGAVARYNRTNSDRGKFVDVLVDSTTFSIFVIGLMHAGWLGAATGGMLIYLAIVSRVLMIIRKNIGRHSDWLFYATSGPIVSGVIYSMYAVFTFDTFSDSDYLPGASKIFAIILATKVVADFWQIRYRLKRP